MKANNNPPPKEIISSPPSSTNINVTPTPSQVSVTPSSVSSSNSSILTYESEKDFLKFQDFEEQFQSFQQDEGQPKEFLFPKDDIQVDIIERQIRTTETSIPKEADIKKEDGIVQDCIKFFSQNLVNIKKNYEQFTNVLPQIDNSNLTEQPFLIDLKPEQIPNKGDDLNEELLKQPISEDKLRAQKKKNRIKLFQTFRIHDTGFVLDPRKKGNIWTEKQRTQILFHIKELSFELGSIEPFFGTVALFDAKKKLKISENFYFDINSSEINDLLGQFKEKTERSKLSNKSIFFVTEPHSAIYLVISIEKVIRGDEEESSEPYFKPASLKPKEKSKLETDIKEACSRIGQFHQSFAWGIIPLFDENGELLKDLATYEIKNLHKVKGEIFAHISEYEKTKQKLRTIPGKCVISVTKVDKDISGRLDPSFLPVKPTADDQPSFIREIRELLPPDTNILPNLDYVNDLYVYLDSVNFNNYTGSSARNIAVEVKVLENDLNLNAEGLPLIYGIHSFVTKKISSVTYHNKKPKFQDEIKIKLPFNLNSNHHLLFTFYHVQCQSKKSKDGPAAQILGYSIVPLWDENKIIKDNLHNYPVASSLLPPYKEPKSLELAKWIDDKKLIFSFRTKLVSSIYTQDDFLDKFFRHIDSSDVLLLQNLKGLLKVELPTLISFFPIILKLLFRIICTASPKVSQEAFLILIAFLDMVHQATWKNTLLESYIAYYFTNESIGSKLLHEKICIVWNQLLQERNEKLNDTFKYAWFLFGILIKSMITKLSANGDLQKNSPRSEFFSSDYTNSLKTLIRHLTKQVRDKSSTAFSLAKFLNLNVSLFLKDLISILDRGLVFELIFDYVISLNPDNSSAVLVDFKFTCLRIICDHEHYIPLNLPQKVKIESVADAREHFWKNHFLSGLLVHQIESTLSQPEPEIRLNGIDTLRYLFQRHDFDVRYQAKGIKTKVREIYFPLLLVILDHWETISQTSNENEKSSWLICFLWILKGCSSKFIAEWWKKDIQKRKILLFDVLSLCLELFKYEGKKSLEASIESEESFSSSPTDTSNTKKKDKKSRLSARYAKASAVKSSPIVSFQRQDTKELLENFYKPGDKSDRRNSELRAWAAPRGSRGEATPTQRLSQNLTGYDFLLDQNLFQEISYIVLSCTMKFMEVFNADLLSRNSVYSSKVFGILTSMLQKNQSIPFLSSLFVLISWITFEFKKPLFKYPNSICGELTYEIIRYCNEFLPSVRADACAILYLLISSNYKQMNKMFSRMKLQCTIAISRLVENVLDLERLKKSLQVVTACAKKRHPKSNLGPEIEDMVKRLFGVIGDSLQMEQSNYDPEKKAELIYKISLGYIDSPDLRVTWLDHLANDHYKEGNYEECAQTKILIAALVSGYLKLLELPEFPKDFPSDFSSIFPNIKADLTFPDSSSLLGLKNEICQSEKFTVKGFVDLLLDSVQNLQKGDLYESCIEVYRLVLPIHQKRRDYFNQSKCYKQLNILCDMVVSENLNSLRLFFNYYRVAFYGECFENLNGTEWVYKEQSSVRLPDISDRLMNQYGNRFGKDKVHLLPNTKSVILSELQSGHCYLQIIALEIYHTPEELKKRPSLFEQHFNVKNFLYETPFTKSEKVYGDMADQYKRKTFLTVENAFPYLKKRSIVVKKSRIELTPIETAREVIEKKNNSLKAELALATPNVKALQLGLQGSLLLQVNSGPLEICRIFLGDNMTKYNKQHVEALINTMNEFVAVLGRALEKNQELITSDQLVVQKSLQEGYRTLKLEVAKYMEIHYEEEEEEAETESTDF